jgi:hypothetical protein
MERSPDIMKGSKHKKKKCGETQNEMEGSRTYMDRMCLKA